MISKLCLVAFTLTFICISAKPSNPGDSFRQVSFHFRVAGKLWWRNLHSVGLAVHLEF
mgnify:CR=1 FL=1